MRKLSIIAALLISGALLAPSAHAQQKVAVVRVPEVVRNMAEGKKASQAGQARETEAKQEGAKRGQAIQQLQSQLQQLKPGSPQYNQLRDQLQEQQDDYEAWAKKTERSLGRAAKEDLRKMFDHVNEATQQVAQEQHINLVVADAAPEITGPNLDQLTVQQFEGVLAQRIVLFADKSVDITQDVLTRVDANFVKQNQTGPQPTSGK